MSWLWWGLATWLAFNIAAAALWSAYRNRIKRQEIQAALQAIGLDLVPGGRLERDHLIVLAGRRRIVQAALDQIPRQTRRTEEDQ